MSKYSSGKCEDKSAELRLPLRSPTQCHFALILGLLWVLRSEPLKALVSLHQHQIWKQHLAYSWILREGYTENRKCEIMVWATALPVTCVGIIWLLSLQATFYKTLIGNLLSALNDDTRADFWSVQETKFSSDTRFLCRARLERNAKFE